MNGNVKFIDGGVTSPEGFLASGVLCRIKESRKTCDVALIYSEKICNAAAVFTQNRVKAEPVKLTKKNIQDGKLQAVIANSGNANCCTGSEGEQVALKMAEAVSSVTGCKPSDVAVCSTGVIGMQLPFEKINAKIQELKNSLSKEGHKDARCAIMTTDTKYKECALEFSVGGKKCHIGTMAKGSGMIHINLGTMLGFITTDCAISSAMLEKALKESVKTTYNCVSVDGDTSTNDTLLILANGMAGNPEIKTEGEDFNLFLEALNKVNRIMAMKIASDGEGATRLVQCTVNGASSEENARALAKQVISSSLVKAAMFGCDANFGRFLCAMGYSGIEFNPQKVNIWFTSKKNAERYFENYDDFSVHGENSVQVYKDGSPIFFDEEKAKQIMSEEAVEILIQCGDGSSSGVAWGCDLTYDYVKINGDYRT